MKTWWNNLAVREQKILLAGGILLLLILCYTVIWHPFTQSVKDLRETNANQQTLLVWMKNQLPEFQSLSKRQQASTVKDSRSLLSIVESALQTGSIAPYAAELTQGNDQKINVHFAMVPFNDLLLWLDKLNNKFNIQVGQIAIERTDSDGLITAQVMLQN